jgi:Pyridoxamine 5'-phosphate oxidase
VIHAQLPDGVLQEMPEQIRSVLAEAREVEFATISARGVPVNNPLFHYYGPAGTTIDLATGVAYPAKADRARRNPRVGLLFAPGIAAQDPVVKGSLPGQVSMEGTPAVSPGDRPVAVICATASVRDSDIQANTDRYVRDFLRDHPLRVPWEQDRERVWYYARIYIECTPRRVLFWPAGASGGAAPVVWEAPPQWRARPSDPAPVSRGAGRQEWPASAWRETAMAVLADIPIPTLTVIDADGYPLPFPTTGARITDEGFELSLPGRLPWSPAGPACLTFAVSATFLGTVRHSAAQAIFTVDRLVGNLPLSGNKLLPGTSPQARKILLSRLEEQLELRNQPMPEVRLIPDGAARAAHGTLPRTARS